MKIPHFLIIAALFVVQAAKAQTMAYDSAKVIETARHNASSFKLNPENLKKFNTVPFPTNSDIFKPIASSTTDATLLNDSLYVNTFRNAAFYNAVNQKVPVTFKSSLVKSPRRYQMRYRPDYTAGGEKAAQHDAGSFKLSQPLIRRFKKEHFANTSDYFKPDAKYCHDPKLLSDSAYIKTFRDEAFYKALNQEIHPVGTRLLVAGSILVFIGGGNCRNCRNTEGIIAPDHNCLFTFIAR